MYAMMYPQSIWLLQYLLCKAAVDASKGKGSVASSVLQKHMVTFEFAVMYQHMIAGYLLIQESISINRSMDQ